jgi:hypothetical protein
MDMSADQIVALHDARVIASGGEDLGEVDQVFLDGDTDQPAWVTIGAGLFDGPQRFVPLAGAQIADGRIRVPYSKDLIAGAPRFADAADGHHARGLQGDQNPYTYYGLDVADAAISAHSLPTE